MTKLKFLKEWSDQEYIGAIKNSLKGFKCENCLNKNCTLKEQIKNEFLSCYAYVNNLWEDITKANKGLSTACVCGTPNTIIASTRVINIINSALNSRSENDI